jgi:outer membrane lipoprotein-sorting protein
MIFVSKKINDMKYLLIFSVLLSTTIFSQSKDTEKDSKSQTILDQLSQKMKGYKTFQIEFSAHIKNSASGTNESEIGKGWVKGNKYCASYGENTIICNGVKTWTVIKEEKSVYQNDVNNEDEESINPKKLMTIWESGFKNKFDHEEVLNGEKVYVINLYPKDPKKVEYHTIILYIAKDKQELRKAIMKTKDGTVMTYSVTKLTENVAIDDTKFVIDMKKYPGYHLVKD